jgi:hypothetical protein
MRAWDTVTVSETWIPWRSAEYARHAMPPV